MKDFVLATWFTRWQDGIQHNLAASDSESLSIPALLDMADAEDEARWRSLRLGYVGPAGSPWLRQSIAALYDTLMPNQVACFSGAQEALFCAMHALLRAGDHAVVVTPNYHTAEAIPAELCATDGVALDAANGWKLDIDAVKAVLRPNTRLLSVNFPNNPTGTIPAQADWAALIELCRQRGIWLFSDEVYRLIEHAPGCRLTAAADDYERGISLNVVSKAYGLAGLRVGWLACADQALLTRAVRIRERLSGSGAAPSEVLANIAIKAADRIVGRNRALAHANLERMDRFFRQHPDLFGWTRPAGGVIAFPSYNGPGNVEAFAERLAAQAGILVVPGSAFASALTPLPTNHFRVGFGRADMAAGLDALAGFIAAGLSGSAPASVATRR